MSDWFRSRARSVISLAPAETKASSGKPLPLPTPGSNCTVKFKETKRATVAGMIAERGSVASVSLGKPIIMFVDSGLMDTHSASGAKTQAERSYHCDSDSGVAFMEDSRGQGLRRQFGNALVDGERKGGGRTKLE